MLSRIKGWARRLKRDSHAVYLAARDPRVPWHVKLLALAVAGYALSPIDLIPDFIPVVGYLDDLVIVPLGVWLVLLGWWASESGEDAGEPVGDGGGDRVAVP